MVSKTHYFVVIFGYILLSAVYVQSEKIDFNKFHDAEGRLKGELLKQYSKDILPPHNSTTPVVISIDLRVRLIKDLDAASQTLITESRLILLWKDTRLAWKPANYAYIGEIRFSPDVIWKPDVHLYNSAQMNEMGTASVKRLVLLYNDGLVVWVPPTTLHSLCMVDLKNYPFDKHTCSLQFGSWTFGGDNLDVALIRSDQTILDLSGVWNDAGEWEIVGSTAVKNSWTYECCNETYPDVVFSITLQRRSPFYKAAIGCPLIAAVFLLLTSFWISPFTYHRITLLAVVFFTVIALLMHLKSKLPAVGKEVPLIMTFCGTLLIISTLAILCSVACRTIATSHKTSEIPELMKKVLQNRILNTLCITTPLAIEDNGKSNGWLTLFIMVDRLFFVVLLIIFIVVMVASSG